MLSNNSGNRNEAFSAAVDRFRRQEQLIAELRSRSLDIRPALAVLSSLVVYLDSLDAQGRHA